MWFLVGGVIGVVLFWWRLLRYPTGGGHWVQATIVAFVAGAAVPGTILWLIFG